MERSVLGLVLSPVLSSVLSSLRNRKFCQAFPPWC